MTHVAKLMVCPANAGFPVQCESFTVTLLVAEPVHDAEPTANPVAAGAQLAALMDAFVYVVLELVSVTALPLAGVTVALVCCVTLVGVPMTGPPGFGPSTDRATAVAPACPTIN
ncbi:MAG TPA: hypothetical protein VGC55_10655 [Dokdonella sp.]